MRVPKRPRLERDLGCDGDQECRWASSADGTAHDLPEARRRPVWRQHASPQYSGQFQELRKRNDTPSEPPNTQSATFTVRPDIPTVTAPDARPSESVSDPNVEPTTEAKSRTSAVETPRSPDVPSESIPTQPLTTFAAFTSAFQPQIPSSTVAPFVPPPLVITSVSDNAPSAVPPALPDVPSVVATASAVVSSIINGPPNFVPEIGSVANSVVSEVPPTIAPKLRTAATTPATTSTPLPIAPVIASLSADLRSSVVPLVGSVATVAVNGVSTIVTDASGALSTIVAGSLNGASSILSNIGGLASSIAAPLGSSQISSILSGDASASADALATTTAASLSTTPTTTSLATLTDSTSFVVISGSTVSTEFHTTVTTILPTVTGGGSGSGSGAGSGSGSGGAASGGQSSNGNSAGDSSGASSGSSGGDKSGSSVSNPVVVGGVVGGLAGLALLLLLILLLLRWRKNALRQRIGSTGGIESERLHSAFDDEPETRSKNPLAAAAALIGGGAFFRKLKHGEKPAGDSSDRGFLKISGRRVDPAVTVSSMSAAAATAGTDSSTREQHRPLTPLYRDSHSFFAGDVSPETREITTPIRPFPQNLRTAPPPPSRPPRLGSPNLDPFVDNFSFPNPPRSRRGPIGIRDGVGRSLPSQDGSRASRFTEEIE